MEAGISRELTVLKIFDELLSSSTVALTLFILFNFIACYNRIFLIPHLLINLLCLTGHANLGLFVFLATNMCRIAWHMREYQKCKRESQRQWKAKVHVAVIKPETPSTGDFTAKERPYKPTSLAHWAVIIERHPGKFSGVHAVAGVSAGKGWITHHIDHNKYELTFVGFLSPVFEEQIREQEPLSGSENCQDFAVFHAVSISENRFLVYLYCLATMPRFRLAMFLPLLLLGSIGPLFHFRMANMTLIFAAIECLTAYYVHFKMVYGHWDAKGAHIFRVYFSYFFELMVAIILLIGLIGWQIDPWVAIVALLLLFLVLYLRHDHSNTSVP